MTGAARIHRQFPEADVAVVYFAGHGMEVDGNNYLVPVDAVLELDVDIYDEALSLERVLVAVEPAKQLRLLILDACRDNPFARSMKRTIASRAVGRGLAKVEPASPNTLIAFASKAGSTAGDGDGKNSPFTEACPTRHKTRPRFCEEKPLGTSEMTFEVYGQSSGTHVYGSLGGDDVPFGARQAGGGGTAGRPRRRCQAGLRACPSSRGAGWLGSLPSCLSLDGFYANLAKVQLRKIAAEEARCSRQRKISLGRPGDLASRRREGEESRRGEICFNC